MTGWVRALISAPSRYDELLITAISLWEFAKFLEKRRFAISGDSEAWFREPVEIPKLRLVPLSPSVAYRSTILPQPFHDEPADQIIVATACEENATGLTADERIRSYPHCRSMW